jgi:hypothetical protein
MKYTFKIYKFKMEDKYTRELLIERYNMFKNAYIKTDNIINSGIPINHDDIPNDISENIVKFIIQNYENDLTCKWNGNLYSEKYSIKSNLEIKAFTSKGNDSFGPKKRFKFIYFLDMSELKVDKLILWKVILTSKSSEWNSIKIKQNQKIHIVWDKLYPQISEHCSKIYEGNFEDIFKIGKIVEQ